MSKHKIDNKIPYRKLQSCSKEPLTIDENDNKIMLVQADTSEPIVATETSVDLKATVENNEYSALKKLEEHDIIHSGSFNCLSCNIWIGPNDGVLLRECFHNFCKPCLKRNIIEDESVACPEQQCYSMLEHREIRGLLSKKEFEQYLNGSLKLSGDDKNTRIHLAKKEIEIVNQLDDDIEFVPPEKIVRFSDETHIELEAPQPGSSKDLYVNKPKSLHNICNPCLKRSIIEDGSVTIVNELNDGIAFIPPKEIVRFSDEVHIIVLEAQQPDIEFIPPQKIVRLSDEHIELEEPQTAIEIPPEKTVRFFDEVHIIELEAQQPGCSKDLYVNKPKSLPLENIIRTDSFICPICNIWIRKNQGIILIKCLHKFCEKCLRKMVLNYVGPIISCPNPGKKCPSPLEHDEIQALMTQEQFDDFLVKSLHSTAIENVKSNGNLDYLRLIELEDQKLVRYGSEFECPICLSTIKSDGGIILKNCLHIFCEECLVETIRSNTGMNVECPYMDENSISCNSHLRDSEIKQLLPLEEHKKFVEQQLRLSEQMLPTVHCAKPNCPGFEIIDNTTNDKVFICEVCRSTNCIRCKAIHINMSCAEYKNPDKHSTNKINKMIEKQMAMLCPKCSAILTKISGCSAIVCSICKTDICWATRGPRWGPKGKGDISGGCRCRVNGKRCHPKCTNCH